MKTMAFRKMIVLIPFLFSTLMVSGQTFPGGGYQGGGYGSGGKENISGIENPYNYLTDITFNAYPNPFYSQSVIQFVLTSPAKVELIVFDINNRKVKVLISPADYPPGNYTRTWDGSDDNGSLLAKGIYYYKMTQGDKIISRIVIFSGR